MPCRDVISTYILAEVILLYCIMTTNARLQITNFDCKVDVKKRATCVKHFCLTCASSVSPKLLTLVNRGGASFGGQGGAIVGE